MKYNESHYNRKNRRSPMGLVTKIGFVLLVVVALGSVGFYFWVELGRPEELLPQPTLILRERASSSIPEPVIEEEYVTYYEVGRLFETDARQAYRDGDLVLYVPRLDLKVPILDGVDEETLKRGVGLFDLSLLPGPLEENANVSIAGHRDIEGMEFYYIDTITNGDRIYLTWQGNLYTYEYETTFTTNPKDWDPIRVKPYPAITMQSCTPIGTATDRIFVIGRLIEVTEGADFPTKEEAEAAAQASLENNSDNDIPFPLFADDE